MEGWILLYKKIWNNPRFYKNHKALAILLWLLTHCNEQGIVTCGRKQIANDCGLSDSCVYRFVKSFAQFYLENPPIIDIKSNNRFSTIHILKYPELQHKMNSRANNQRTTSEQPVNTNKEERIKNNNIDTQTAKEAKELLEYYNQLSGKKLTSFNSLLENLTYWRKDYSILDIKEALRNFLQDSYWKDKGTLEILLRRRNPQGEAVDRIGKYKNKDIIKKQSPYVGNNIIGVV